MKRLVLNILLTSLLLICAAALVIMAIELYKTRNQLDFLQERHAEFLQQIQQIEQDLAAKDEYLEKLFSDPVFLERVVRERLGWSKPEEWIYRFPQEDEEEENRD